MAFETLGTHGRTAYGLTSDPDSVCAGVYTASGGRPRLTFFIGANIVKAMGLPLEGARVLIGEGSGADFGMFQITPADPSDKRGLALTYKSGAKDPSASRVRQVATPVALTRSLAHLLPATTIKAEVVTWQRFGSALTVCIPWCREPSTDGDAGEGA